MRHRFLICTFAVLVALLSGCATRRPMAFSDDTQQLNELSKPVYLMAVTVRNSYRTSFHPRLHTLWVDKSGAKDTAETIRFHIDDKSETLGAGSPEIGNSYLLRLELDPGDYRLVTVNGMSMMFPFIGHFIVPIHSDLKADARPGVYYLGHLDATVRERQGSEFRAGPVIPLLDQAVAGASGGTYDVAITDAFDTDEKVFRTRYPALKDAVITKAVLPPFDRGRAQDWWEAH